MRFLVVDSDQRYRNLIQDVLQAGGHRTTSIGTVDGALAQLEREHFDAVVTEWSVDNHEGIRLLDEYQQHALGSSLGLVVITEPLGLATLSEAFDAGLDGYISKPIDVVTLLDEIEDLLSYREPESLMEEMSGLEEFTLDDPLRASQMEGEADRIGTVLEKKYQVEAYLGSGAMGDVYRARHLFLDRAVAIKILPAGRFADREAFSALVREARIVSQLRHDNIVTLHDFGFTDEEIPYLVMEYMEGPTLREVLQRHPRLSARLARSVTRQVLEGLAAVHESGVLHLDLKPSNLMFATAFDVNTRDASRLKILDFGVARLHDRSTIRVHGPNQSIAGSAAYMSPEQCSGESLGPASDLYSLGALLYQMLVGAPPFSGPDRAAVLHHHQHSEPTPPQKIRPGIPDTLAELISDLLCKDPEERLSSAVIALKRLSEAPVALEVTMPPRAEDTFLEEESATILHLAESPPSDGEPDELDSECDDSLDGGMD